MELLKMSMTGHKKYEAMKPYVRILDPAKREAIEKLKCPGEYSLLKEVNMSKQHKILTTSKIGHYPKSALFFCLLPMCCFVGKR